MPERFECILVQKGTLPFLPYITELLGTTCKIFFKRLLKMLLKWLLLQAGRPSSDSTRQNHQL